MAGVALAGVRLGHECEAHAVLCRDLLGTCLVNRMVVAGGQRVGVAERDLVLAQVALALGRLDVHARAGHAQPDAAHQRLHPAGAEDGVVHVVQVHRGEVAVGHGLRVLVGVAVHAELQLGAGERGPATGRQPVGLRLEDLPGRGDHRGAVGPGQVGQEQRARLVPRQVAQRAEVGHEDEVPVPALPGRHLIPVHRVHVDVHGEQVVAPLRVVADHIVEEELRRYPLALQAPLHVGEREHDRVDRARAHRPPQPVQGEHPRTGSRAAGFGHCHVVPSSGGACAVSWPVPARSRRVPRPCPAPSAP